MKKATPARPTSDNSVINEADLRAFVLGSTQKMRFLQETPILPDVWVELARCAIGQGSDKRDPFHADLLIVPHNQSSARTIAIVLAQAIEPEAVARARIAVLRSELAAKLSFSEVFRILLPMTGLWQDHLEAVHADGTRVGEEMLKLAAFRISSGDDRPLQDLIGESDRSTLWRLLILAGLVAYLELDSRGTDKKVSTVNALLKKLLSGEARPKDVKALIDPLQQLWDARLKDLHDFLPRASRASRTLKASVSDQGKLPEEQPARIWTINENRRVTLAMHKARCTVKADAIERLFNTNASNISWAIIDSGIDARHPAFAVRDGQGKIPEASWANQSRRQDGIHPAASRVKATYDFTRLRRFIALQLFDESRDEIVERDREELAEAAWTAGLELEDALTILQSASNAVRRGTVADWTSVLPLLKIVHDSSSDEDRKTRYKSPPQQHGTHVAGILGANWRACEGTDDEEGSVYSNDLIGVAPDICFYDLRVLDANGEGDEFDVLAALQFVSHLNADRSVRTVHGINVSLQVAHRVRNFGCGQTPICLECDRLMAEGTVVVAAAGNYGFEELELASWRRLEMHRAISIADPGNAETIITVGATHRDRPHTYGVSYFSSRGPTGDGRRKPDLLAPGERIFSTIPLAGSPVRPMADWADGTSMAAPHVSGAAALLMARHPELIGKSHQIKDILMRSATDLGRDKNFQGAGLLDILRALQSV